MATAKLTIWHSKITPEKNAKVENPTMYFYNERVIASPRDATIQYQKIELNMRLKVAGTYWTQATQAIDDNGFNYAMIQQDGHFYYFFILSKEWTSENCLSLQLHMDTVNTFDGKYELDNKTKIQRQHRDRFYNTEDFDREEGGLLVRRIDREAEGITGTLKLDSDSKIYDTKDSDHTLDWYLIYKSKIGRIEDYQPIKYALCASKRLKIGGEGPEGRIITPDTFQTNQYYYFTGLDNPGAQFAPIGIWIGGDNTWTAGIVTMTAGTLISFKVEVDDDDTRHLYMCLNKTCSQNEYGGWEESPTGSLYTTGYRGPNYSYTGIKGQRVVKNGNADKLLGPWIEVQQCVVQNTIAVRTSQYDWHNLGSYGLNYSVSTKVAWSSGGDGVYITDIDGVDRTDTTLIKIIKLPYCPIDFTKTGDLYTFSDEWEWDPETGLLIYRYEDFFEFNRTDLATINLEPYFYYNLEQPASFDDEPLIERESKLYNSSFFYPIISYDGFNTGLSLEDYWGFEEAPLDHNYHLYIDFKPTNTVNSKMAFKINTDDISKYSTELYDNILLVTSNNEETVLNSDFLDYMRYGYQYDKENQAIQEQQAKRQAVWSSIINGAQVAAQSTALIGGIGSLGSMANAAAYRSFNSAGFGDLLTEPQFITGNRFLASKKAYTSTLTSGIAENSITAALLGGSANNITTAWLNYNNIKKQNANQMAAKIANLQTQITGIAGTDDIDLRSWYTGNKLHLSIMNTIPEEKQAIYDIFKYSGYSYNHQETPNISSRYWFNFIQCTPHYKDSQTKILPEFLNDITSRYEAGVTVYHPHYLGPWGDERDLVWDIDQEYENWETWLVYNEWEETDGGNN